MTTGEYILALMAIISGLAISHLVGAASTLIEHRRQVRWDWLAVLAGFYLAYIVIYGWWVSFAAFHAEKAQLPFYRFLLPTLNVVFLALAARAVLPERVPEEGLDLRAHYTQRCRFVFGCLLMCQAISTWGVVRRLRAGTDLTRIVPGGHVPYLIGVAAVVVLTFTRRRVVHAVVLPPLFASMLIGSIAKMV